MMTMNEPRQKRVEEIFHGALERPRDDRERYVDDRCGADTGLRDSVLELLQHHARAERMFTPRPDGPEDAERFERIGPFRIIKLLGQGGMGAVFLAHQESPISREVALKVIRAGMDSQQVLDRFQAEQQALALLDHPSVAKVLDAGSTDEGRPYFVMEYVPGSPITEYCDENQVSFRQRIALFLEVCHAIQHAHQKGIIHRDIKPGNVIVTEHDGAAVPKVIDFGVAKATGAGAMPAAKYTGAGQLIGTLEYMSPEQVDARDIDTRSDVYSLGLLLYELLVGVLPFDAATLDDRGVEAMMRVIRDSEPPRPSDRVSTMGDKSVVTARRRGTEPRALARALRGDIDWVVMKALEKDRERRYESAAGLALDLSRYLSSQPVEARPPSALYRMQKFVRRHRVGVAASSVVVASLVAVASITAVQSARVTRERDRAEYEERVSRDVAGYLGNMFHKAAVSHGFPDSVRLVQAMAMGVEDLDEADVTPQARIRILRVLGEAYSSMTKIDDASPIAERLVELSVDQYGENHIETAQSRFLLAKLRRQEGRGEEALELTVQVLPVFERELGVEDPQTLRCVWYLAGINRELGLGEAAITYYERLSDAYRRTLGGDHPRLGMLLSEMAATLGNIGRYDEGLEAGLVAVDILETKYGKSSPMVLLPLEVCSALYAAVERYDEALAILDRTERIVRDTYGAGHPEAKHMRGERGWILLEVGRLDGARIAFEEALEVPGNVPERHLADPMLGLGITHRKMGQIAASREKLERCIGILVVSPGAPNPKLAEALTALGETESAAGNAGRADSLLRAAVEMSREVHPPGHTGVATCELALGEYLVNKSRFVEAEPLLTGALASYRKTYSPESPRVARARRSLVELYQSWGKPDVAERYMSRD
jgi:non-specific serine/threonine protein kinase/serine/threonine-protein kinase